MIKRIIGISILGLGLILGGYFSIYFSLIDNPTMLLVLSVVIASLFVLGIFLLILDARERKVKNEKKIILEMIKKARTAQERQSYSGAFDDLRRRGMY
jgi:phosphate/sulfate permease